MAKKQSNAADPTRRFEIRTPAPGFTGERFGVRFRDGVGTTDNKAAAQACREQGYAVNGLDEVAGEAE